MHAEEIGKNLPALFAALFVSILFIQSGLDKVFHWNDQLSWLTEHFAETFLKGMVPVMMATITVMEVATGFFAAAGIIYLLAAGSLVVMFYAAVLGALSLTALFFGQRIAEDYPGAAVLVPYFLLVLALMYLTNPYLKVL